MAPQSPMQSSSENTAHSANSSRTLVVMAKAPRPGMVKTRLAQSLPVEAVTALYRCLLDDTIALAQCLGTVEVAIMCPASDVDDLASFAGESVSVVAQSGDGLAAGLTSVFEHFAAFGGQRVIAFNSDSPHLPAAILERAFEALRKYDVVVGPTHDGGYYLVGARASHPDLFHADGMGRSNALATLLARIESLRLSVRLADPFYDIDVASDLIRLDEELRVTPARSPRTAAWLAEWRHVIGQLQCDRTEL